MILLASHITLLYIKVSGWELRCSLLLESNMIVEIALTGRFHTKLVRSTWGRSDTTETISTFWRCSQNNHSDLFYIYYYFILLFFKMMNLPKKSPRPARAGRKLEEAKKMALKVKIERRRPEKIMMMQQKRSESELKRSRQISKEKRNGRPLLSEITCC